MRAFFLWLHIGLAVVAFGPTFTFPVWTASARAAGGPAMPHTLRTIERLFLRVILPGAILLPFTGVVLIYVTGIDLWGSPWLIAAIAIYTVSFGLAVGIGLPNLRQVLRILGREGGPGPEGMAEVGRRAGRQRALGYANNALFLIILLLMVWKPGT